MTNRYNVNSMPVMNRYGVNGLPVTWPCQFGDKKILVEIRYKGVMENVLNIE